MKVIGLVVAVCCGAVLIFITSGFPRWADPGAPAAGHVSAYYVEHSIPDTSVPNIVTAVLADYRGYDTMFETTVIFAAGIACLFLLKISVQNRKKPRMYRHKVTGITIHVEEGGRIPRNSEAFERIDKRWVPYDIITQTTSRLLFPFIQVFALYVIAHGHHSPGGGFQGGVILGAAIILFALTHNLREAVQHLGERIVTVFSSAGVLIYVGTGAICLLLGHNFLDYAALADILGTDPITARSHGILLVEIGVGLAVMAVMVFIYYNVSSAGTHEEGL